MSNKKKNTKVYEDEQEQSFKLDRKTVTRILAGTLAGLMVLGTIAMTIMYLLETFHAH